MTTRKTTLVTAVTVTMLLLGGGAFGAAPKKPAKPAKGKSLLEIPDVARDKVICVALYTVHDNILKLTTQLYPLQDGEDRTVRLEVKQGGAWKQIATTKVIEDGWTAPFRVEKWEATKTVEYRVRHGKAATFGGTIQKDPVEKDKIVVVFFTGNSIHASHGGDIARTDLIKNVQRIQPDLLFFSGDQVYDHKKHYAAWLKFGRDFGEIIRNIPTVTIPDDHDVGQPNIWGAGGKKSTAGGASDGGYAAPPAYVKQVERAQTSHLPDPYDPTPILQGIGVYYTALRVGRVSFAIIEDRKFKSGPKGLVPQQGPRPDHIRNPDYDPKSVDVPGAVLLGERQLKFLRDWSTDWSGADMKCVLSQTVFANAAHIHGKVGGRLHADMDSNGWPQSGRNRALREIRKGFAVMLCGDQHLGTIIHHGIDDWNDSGWSFCVPSIANLYLRWWDPLTPGKNREPGAPEYTGEHLDGFANKVTMWAAANPGKGTNGGTKLTTRAAGFGVARFDCTTRKITMECWPRNVDITSPKTKQYLGWPKTVDQEDNYGRKAVAYLPTLKITGQNNPVVQVIDESDGEVIYTLRINGTSFRPKVFQKGTYTVKVGEGDSVKTLKGVKSVGLDSAKTMDVKF